MIYWQVMMASFLAILFLNMFEHGLVKSHCWFAAIMGSLVVAGMTTGMFWLLSVLNLVGGM